MGENSSKDALDYPQFETLDDVLAFLNKEAEGRVHSWADLYAGLKATFETYRSNPCKATADYAVFVMHCWVLALEDLPEEGDALVIAKKMNEIMALGASRTGVSFLVGAELRAKEEEEQKRAEQATQMVSQLREVLTTALSGDTPDDMKKRTIH